MSAPVPRWEHFVHDADMGVCGIGASLEQAFEQAALAMTAIIADPATIRPLQAVELHCRGEDPELLLVDWLNALVFEMATRRMLFSRFQVRIDGGALEAIAWGETLDVNRHQPAVEVKGATYTALGVEPLDGGLWRARCVVDV